MADESSNFSIAKLTLPISMLTTIIGGSAWLTSTRNEVVHLRAEFNKLEVDFKQNREAVLKKVLSQDSRLSRMEGKQDLILQQLQMIERKLVRRRIP